MNLRQITKKDQTELIKVYFDSIKSINDAIYNKEQKYDWSSQAWDNPIFKKSLREGKGWLIKERDSIIAFATRYPSNRVSLLYCMNKYQKKGYGTKLILKLEEEAIREGIGFLSTEASLISYKLFLKNNWQIIRKEKIIIKNNFFERYKMIKIFN